MIELIASTIITVSCADINTLIDRAKTYPDITESDRQEVIESVSYTHLTLPTSDLV